LFSVQASHLRCECPAAGLFQDEEHVIHHGAGQAARHLQGSGARWGRSTQLGP
jgi:hypothetical protein